MSGTELLNIMTTTLSESWGLILSIESTQNYGLDLEGRDEHWTHQTEMHLRFLREFWDNEKGFHSDCAYGALEMVLFGDN